MRDLRGCLGVFQGLLRYIGIYKSGIKCVAGYRV